MKFNISQLRTVDGETLMSQPLRPPDFVVAGFYSIVIILGIFTTATGQLFILADRFSQQGTKKFYAIVFGTVAFGIATGSFIPFTTIVNIVYSVLGLSGVILSVFLLVKIIRVRRSGAAEAG